MCGVSGRVIETDRASLERQLESGRFLWLDLHHPGEDELRSVGDTLGLHPLALEDAHAFGQRPKIDEYEGFVLLVVYGTTDGGDGLVEVHCFYSERYLVTVHRDPSPALDGLELPVAKERGPHEGIALLHEVVDRLTDSFAGVLEDVDAEAERIENELLPRAQADTQSAIFALRRRILRVRRVAGPQRDAFSRIAGGNVALPGLTDEARRYFRDVEDHLIRTVEDLDSYRDRTVGASEVYLSTVSNRLNQVMKQLTLISTVFLPLTFLTGIFGQNFDWLVSHVDSLTAFLLLGVVLPVLALSALVVWFRRRGWI